ncbi:hypothetical protein EV11_1029 [Prochlorococcus sp. SS52]|nr:hypothetical protein EV04_1624 [Prochlorococcus marinus str. LG]KGG21085.1 hypothetical protein EV08_0801 [Prochlorococcus marinus str. SS2]KGG23911.1 hypothetical protein EV09_0514 [Prochlorococcus marinus str. SS35]KGG31830.1 hypothetical protein EV10_1928 [Prochlorococcus marinus str. SS51]KGG36005.1 hypothetical protein EV11_1029 [Prochlorococcus sp. SS52]
MKRLVSCCFQMFFVLLAISFKPFWESSGKLNLPGEVSGK